MDLRHSANSLGARTAVSKKWLPHWLKWQYCGRNEQGGKSYYERDWVEIILLTILCALVLTAIALSIDLVVSLLGVYGAPGK